MTVGDAKKLDNACGTFMAVSIDFLMGASAGRSWGLYAIAHRYVANGDLIPDRDVEFYVVGQPGRPRVIAVYPIAIDHGLLGYHRYAAVDITGEPTLLNRRGQSDLARFCDVWMRNIASQQGRRSGSDGPQGEEFVHQLPTGRCFVGDFVARRGARTSPSVETAPCRSVAELTVARDHVRRSVHLRSHVDAKRAAQRMSERILADH